MPEKSGSRREFISTKNRFWIDPTWPASLQPAAALAIRVSFAT
jgi:hypothetical protein